VTLAQVVQHFRRAFTRIEKMDSAIRIQQKQFELRITSYRDRIKKIRESATSEQVAVVAGMEEHYTAMALRDNTRDELNAAREQYRPKCFSVVFCRC